MRLTPTVLANLLIASFIVVCLSLVVTLYARQAEDTARSIELLSATLMARDVVVYNDVRQVTDNDRTALLAFHHVPSTEALKAHMEGLQQVSSRSESTQAMSRAYQKVGMLGLLLGVAVLGFGTLRAAQVLRAPDRAQAT